MRLRLHKLNLKLMLLKSMNQNKQLKLKKKQKSQQIQRLKKHHLQRREKRMINLILMSQSLRFLRYKNINQKWKKLLLLKDQLKKLLINFLNHHHRRKKKMLRIQIKQLKEQLVKWITDYLIQKLKVCLQ